MAKNEKTGSNVSKTASAVLRDAGASKAAKSLAGSALAQTHTKKKSSVTVAKTAAKVLQDGRTAASTKTLAGSVLTQKGKKK
jgi:hypothetical protein